MNIHEYQAKGLFRDFGIGVLDGLLAVNAKEAVENAKQLGGKKWVIKAQIHAGGRGLGGGVKIANSLKEVEDLSRQILGMNLVTPQTGVKGKVVNKVYIEKACQIEKEYYLSFSFDRTSEKIALIASSNGGMNIEETSKKNPELIKKILIDPMVGFCGFHAISLSTFLGLDKKLGASFSKMLKKIYNLYIETDSILIEINPLALTKDGNFVPIDAKMSFDESSLFRQNKIKLMRDLDEEEPSELEAKEYGLSYVKLDGNIGCIVNGAGLAMGTMDTINSVGGRSANFLDVGGAANPNTVAKAFEIILRDNNVKVIFINIFGGIVRCDRIANGILGATKIANVEIPIVIRLDGTNKKEAMEILKQANLKNIVSASNIEDGAKKAVKLAEESLK